MTEVSLILVAAAAAAVIVAAARHPVPRRLAVRDIVRRPGETALVVAGSLLGTAIITGSFIVGDTLDSSIRATAYSQLGPVDEVVVALDAPTADALARRLRERADDRIDGVLTLTTARAAVATRKGRAEPGAQVVEADFDAARSFGADPDAAGISGPTPDRGEAVATDDLAEALGAGAGDEVTAFPFGRPVPVRITRIVEARGVAGLWLGFETSSPNLFVAPGTIRSALRTAGASAAPPDHLVAVSNRGGVEDGAALTAEVSGVIEDALDGASLRVDPVKRDVLDAAADQGDMFSELFLGIGSFALVAGILLLVNVFVMLAEERKGQLGMLRAVGMRRSDLVRNFVVQGLAYALLAGVLGAVAGIAVGWVIVQFAAPIFGGFGDFALDLRFAMTTDSLVTGACLGALISLATVALTSVRISRINIIRAIRDLPEPGVRRQRVRSLVAGALLSAAAAALSAASISAGGDGWAGAILGPSLVAAGLVPLASRVAGRRAALLGLGTFMLGWGVLGNQLTGGAFFDAGEIFAFVLQGLTLNIAAVLVLGQTQENLEALLRRTAPRSLALRLGLAYPLARRFRTGLTLGMFSLVMFTMVFIAVLSSVFGGQVERVTRDEAGGFDILATSTPGNPPARADIAAIAGVEDVAALRHGTALFDVDALPEPGPWPVSGIDDTFVATGPPALEERAADVPSDGAAWRRLLDDPAAAIVPSFFLQEGGGPPAELVAPGDSMTIIDPVSGARERREVVAVTAQDFAFSGVYMSKRSVESALGARAPASRFYVAASEPDAVASRLQDELVANGVEAETFASRVAQFQAENLQFLRLMQGYLALGLVVGIAGLGVVMVRAVRERRRDIGVLRSLGFVAPMVRRAFVLESGFTAVEGIAVGTVLALVTASQLIATGEFGRGVAFTIPWMQVAVLCTIALGASLLATAWPARRAARIAPAAALRLAE